MGREKIDDPGLSLRDLFEKWPATVTVFQSHGMLCFGCPIAPYHAVVDACLEYGLEMSRFYDALQRALITEDDRAVPPPSPCINPPGPNCTQARVTSPRRLKGPVGGARSR
ncbi:Conserved hypothetical protein CHP03980, redox-disulphide [Paracoccaceae bacterium]